MYLNNFFKIQILNIFKTGFYIDFFVKKSFNWIFFNSIIIQNKNIGEWFFFLKFFNITFQFYFNIFNKILSQIFFNLKWIYFIWLLNINIYLCFYILILFMYGNIVLTQFNQYNYNVNFSNNNIDVILHLVQWQYWWWFWFTYIYIFYYIFFIKFLTLRSLKFFPKIVTSFRSYGKWGDLLICFLPISWCINILTNSNMLLKLIEWQYNTNLLTLRIRGKQWYWIYKFDFNNLNFSKNVINHVGSGFQKFFFNNFSYLYFLENNIIEKKKLFFLKKKSKIFFENNLNKDFFISDNLYFKKIFGLGDYDNNSKKLKLSYFYKISDNYCLYQPQYIFRNSINLVLLKLNWLNFNFKSYFISILLDFYNKFNLNGADIINWKKNFFNSINFKLPLNLIFEKNNFLKLFQNNNFVLKNLYFSNIISYYSTLAFYFSINKSLTKDIIFSNNFIFNKINVIDLNKNYYFFSNEPLILNYNKTVNILNQKKNFYLVFNQKRLDNYLIPSEHYYLNYILNNKFYKLTYFYNLLNYSENINFTYSTRLLKTNNMLVLPIFVQIAIITNSFDVVHSWFIPGLGLKMDCVPGRSTHHTLYIDFPGIYYGQCAEICGRYHHHMPIRICALPFEHFLLWWNHYIKVLYLNEENFPKINSNQFLKKLNF